MAWILDVPSWVIYGLVGAFLGATFGALGFALERMGINGARFLVILGIAITPTVTQQVVYPAIDPIVMCEVARRAASEAQIGTPLDDFTTLGKMTANCDNRAIIYDMDIAGIASADVGPEGWQAVADDFNASQCAPGGWVNFIKAGWSVTNRYTFEDGAQRHLVAQCS